MYTNIIGTQQILITAAFLGVMILLLIILRKKSTVIRASMKAGKRINVVEDAAVSHYNLQNHLGFLHPFGYEPGV